MKRITALIVVGFLAACAPDAPPREGHAFVDVNVVTMQDDEVRVRQTVLVSDGVIEAIGAVDDVDVPRGFERVEGGGAYLAPGLADMHAHPVTERDLKIYAANGVTFLRSMWGEPAVLELRDALATGEILGPRIVTGGRIVDGQPIIHYGSDSVLSAADAERIVAEQKAAGYDFIKVYSNLSQEAFDAIAAAAEVHDIRFEGHIPNAVSAAHAFAAGMGAFEHLIGIGAATAREGSMYVTRFDPRFVGFATALGSGEIKIEDQFDPEKLRALAEAARESGIWTVPTLVTLRGTALPPDLAAVEMARPGYAFVDYTVKSFWELSSDFRFGWTEDTYHGAALLLEQDLRDVKAFADAGARLLVGTDAQNPWAMTGFAVVDELELFVDAGLTPFEALQAATTSPAEYLGEEGMSGVVALGARADLVLMKNNPLDEVAAYRDIQGVMFAGRWADRLKLDELLAEAKSSSDWKASVFAGAPPWPFDPGEAASITAEFVLFRGDEVVGKERIAVTQSAGGPGIVGQSFGDDGSVQTMRPSVVDGMPVLTGSAMDWLALAPRLAGVADGETQTIDVVVGEGAAGTVTVTRQPSEVIVGHFYLTGTNRHDVTIEDADGSRRSMQVWLGGGFYRGWPVKIVVDDGATPLEYRRIL